MARTAHLLLFAALGNSALGQTAYPDLTIQDVTWNSGTHHYAVTNHILSPGSPDLPVTISGTADAEFVSASQVRLLPGFHAGDFAGAGQFHAHIDQNLGSHADLVIISPTPDGSSPYGSIQDNVVHVHKWEKVEVGLRLPQEYQDAVNSFFENYYSDPSDSFLATSGNIVPALDLNPFADDSLQVVLTLTDPNGQQHLRWGFFMREARWTGSYRTAPLGDNPNSLYEYHIRFRFTPDLEGIWQFRLSIEAPYTTTTVGLSLTPHLHTGYTFFCDPPLEDNNGHLIINATNHRTLQFETGEPFFGIGPNLGPNPVGSGWNQPATYSIRRGSYDDMVSDMNALQEAGGNFIRTFLGDKTLAHENVNIGVYDKFRDHLGCALGTNAVVKANAQHHAWVFDRILDHARETGIYIQACATPYPPIKAYETFTWHNDAYLNNFVEPREPNGLYNMRRYFYLNGNPDDALNSTEGPFYYWKRRYKYLMSRWGYSVNMPIIEHFNEIDQMLTYNNVNLLPNPEDTEPSSMCQENRITWYKDNGLPVVLNDWISDIGAFVRGGQVIEQPATSPLGYTNKLFLLSYAGGDPSDLEYYFPFSNENLDLIDVHRAPDNVQDLKDYTVQLEDYRNNFTTNGVPKPFNRGEFTTYGDYEDELSGYSYPYSYGIYDHYNLSFHNELWSSAFAGGFAAGTSWVTQRIFRSNMSNPPLDPGNPSGDSPSGSLGHVNQLFFGYEGEEPRYADVRNTTLLQQIKSLTNFLTRPEVQALGLYSGNFTPRVEKDEDGGIEVFYLINSELNIAVGWVHNFNAYWRNAVYITSNLQDYMECTSPSAEFINLTGFGEDEQQDLYTYFFPTRINSTIIPDNLLEGESTEEGNFVLDFSSKPMNGTFPLSASAVLRNHLDTLHSDYAFIIVPTFIKNIGPSYQGGDVPTDQESSFHVYPNPAHNHVVVYANSSNPKNISILDGAGRLLLRLPVTTENVSIVPLSDLAQGMYSIVLDDGKERLVKKLMIY